MPPIRRGHRPTSGHSFGTDLLGIVCALTLRGCSIQCSGVHRSLGVHVSAVLSTSLDDWEPAMVEHMANHGNAVVNATYEANIPSNYSKPTPNTDRCVDSRGCIFTLNCETASIATSTFIPSTFGAASRRTPRTTAMIAATTRTPSRAPRACFSCCFFLVLTLSF